MARHLPVVVTLDHLDMIVEADDRGRDADLLLELTQGGLFERLAGSTRPPGSENKPSAGGLVRDASRMWPSRITASDAASKGRFG